MSAAPAFTTSTTSSSPKHRKTIKRVGGIDSGVSLICFQSQYGILGGRLQGNESREQQHFSNSRVDTYYRPEITAETTTGTSRARYATTHSSRCRQHHAHERLNANRERCLEQIKTRSKHLRRHHHHYHRSWETSSATATIGS